MAERLSDKYTYQTFWSEEDGEYVSTVAEFPSLSWLDEDAQRSSDGLRALVAEVIADMQQTGNLSPSRSVIAYRLEGLTDSRLCQRGLKVNDRNR